MHTLRNISGSVVLMLAFFCMEGRSLAYDTPNTPLANCGSAYVGVHDFIDLSGFPNATAHAKNIVLDTTLVLIRSASESPNIPEWLPEAWTNNEANFSVSRMRIRNEMLQTAKIKVEIETFLVLKFAAPLSVCDILAGWEAWMLRYKENPNNNLKEAQFVFSVDGERKLLRDFVEVLLIPGVHPDAFTREVLLPLQQENIGFYAGNALIDHKNGVWKVILRTRDMTFPLRAVRILAGQRRFVSTVSPIFVPLVSTISTVSSMDRISSNGVLTRFLDGETIYSEQASFEGALQLSVAIDLLRSETGEPYFKLLTNISEFAKSIEEGIKPKTESVLRIDPSACWEHQVTSPMATHISMHFVCRFVPVLPGRYEITNLPLRFEFARGGTAFTITTDRSFILNTVELRHPEQEGIVSYIGELAAAVPSISPTVVAPEVVTNDPTVIKQMRRTIGGSIAVSIAAVRTVFVEFGDDPRAFLRRYEWRIVATLAIIIVLTFLLRTYFWGWGFIPSMLSATRNSTRFAKNLLQYTTIPLTMQYDAVSALQRVMGIIHKGDDIQYLSTESLALRIGLHLDTDAELFFQWLDTSTKTKLEQLLAALWIEEHARVWQLSDAMVQKYRVQLLKPFWFRKFFKLPAYLYSVVLERQNRGG